MEFATPNPSEFRNVAPEFFEHPVVAEILISMKQKMKEMGFPTASFHFPDFFVFWAINNGQSKYESEKGREGTESMMAKAKAFYFLSSQPFLRIARKEREM